MPRSSPSRSSSSKPSSFVPAPKVQPPYSSVTTPLPTVTPTLGQSMKEGFGLGMGSAIAHRVVGSIFGAPTVNITQPSPGIKNPCEKERFAFESCMKTQSIDTFCGQEQIAYTECIRTSNPTSGQ